MEYKIKKDYQTQYKDPIKLSAGDVVILGEEEKEEKWKGWIWAEHNTQSGWIPLQIVDIMPESKGKIKENYSAKELDVKKGDIVVSIKEMNGWIWVMNEKNEEGWIPADIAVAHKNHLGRISLIASVSGLALTEFLIRSGIADGPVMEVINTGFEGGTVGGLADWFAVSALFKEIPIPYIRRHTNIIVKNRAKISEGVVDLVTNRWLSPEVLKEKLSALDVSSGVSNYFSNADNLSKVIDFLRKEVLSRVAGGLDSPDLSGFLEKTFKEQISKADFAKPLGKWLKSTIENGGHNELIDKILETTAKAMNDQETANAINEKVNKLIEEYKSDSALKFIGLNIAEKLKLIDKEIIAEKIQTGLNTFLYELRTDSDHPIRQKLNNYLINFADGLSRGDESSLEIIDSVKQKLLNNADLGGIITDLLGKAKSSLDEQLESNDTSLMKIVARNIESAAKEFGSNKESQKRFNEWIRETAIQLINSYHHKIGEMVRESLWKLDDKALVGQIEEKVGNDLQFIRLNGAVIGFFAGAVIKVIKLAI